MPPKFSVKMLGFIRSRSQSRDMSQDRCGNVIQRLTLVISQKQSFTGIIGAFSLKPSGKRVSCNYFFSVNFAKFFRTILLQKTTCDCF